ncbi:unnamed protein product [Cylindrotheca closterium]|uniref:DUF6824 domain-containing protein n=1 Tax=Cylindrotheca closterium TaxID=2856 RepID=A0AAD2FG64_9STRA|nr:unnamed protein product [Cylindrotheca closterium]
MISSSSCFNACGDQQPSAFQSHFMADRGGINSSRKNDNDVEASLVQGMKNLTFDQLQREQEDFHGVADYGAAHREQDPKAIGELLQSLDAHLARIKPGTIYETACMKDPAYVSNRDFRMLFLKGNRYDPKSSAEQMIRYFDVKHNLFGDECLVRDITTQDLTEDDIASVMAGGVQMSSCTDSSGRLISWGFPGVRVIDHVPKKNKLRHIFYYGMDLVSSAEDTTKGIVLVSYQVGQYRESRIDHDLHYEVMQLALALPFNIAGYHFCFSDRAHCMLAHTAVSLMPSHLRAKTRIHFGTHFECQYLLSTYGIPREAFPFKHPSNELDLTWQKYWFQQCQERDQRKLQLQASREQSLSPQSLSSTTTTTTSSTTARQKEIDKHIQYLSSLWQGETPSDDDVLCVGRKVNGKGNERYMALAVLHADAYDNGSPKERRDVMDSIMKEVKKHGRFLKLDTRSESSSVGWIQVSDKEMRYKIAQTFRNLKYRRGSSNTAQSRAILETPGGAEAMESLGQPSSAVSSSRANHGSSNIQIVHQYTPRDVLFGRMKNHTGNQRLRELVQNVASEYDVANRGEKLRLANQLMESVKREGGRFLKPLDSNASQWEVVADKEAVKKVGAHFRNFRRKQWR